MEHPYVPTSRRGFPTIGATGGENQTANERRPVAFAWAGIRLSLGFIFAWAFVDKLFGLGFSTPASRAWINGGNPTAGYLGSSVGPFADFFKAIAGDPVTNVLFMFGLAAVGGALLLGMGVRIAGYAGALMMALMYASHVPWAGTASTNPIVDDHVVYAIALLELTFVHAGRTLGLSRLWENSALVRRYPILE